MRTKLFDKKTAKKIEGNVAGVCGKADLLLRDDASKAAPCDRQIYEFERILTSGNKA